MWEILRSQHKDLYQSLPHLIWLFRQYLDNTTYTTFNGQKLLSTGRIRTYSDAISVGTTNNVIATYQITTSWSGDEMQSYKVIKV